MKQTIPFEDMRITPASPYYDRLRSLNIELDFVPFNSPEYHYLRRQVEEMEQRARKHIETNRNIALYLLKETEK